MNDNEQDLVEWLREYVEEICSEVDPRPPREEHVAWIAADEIERLRNTKLEEAAALIHDRAIHIRNAALEEAALVADSKAYTAIDLAPLVGRAAKQIADTIRALKGEAK